MTYQLLALPDISNGVAPNSPLGLAIIVIGLMFTIGLPLLLILKGKKWYLRNAKIDMHWHAKII